MSVENVPGESFSSALGRTDARRNSQLPVGRIVFVWDIALGVRATGVCCRCGGVGKEKGLGGGVCVSAGVVGSAH